MDDQQKTRLATNEDFFRELNEKISTAAESQGVDSHVFEFLCECSDPECAERVHLNLDEYEHIRAEPTRFVVKKTHVLTEIEHVVETAADHVVIEKHGQAGKIAIELDTASGDQ